MNAIVTGGTGGIGRAVSLALAGAGYRVLALYARNREAAEALVKEAAEREFTIECIRGDLTQPERLREIVAELREACPHVDAFVHCAASGVHRPARELTARHLRWTYDINVVAAHELIQGLLDRMPRGARIIGLSSSGATRAIPEYATIGASKGALEALFRHYALEFAPLGIAVNVVCPGLVETRALEAFPDPEGLRRRARQSTPTGALTTPAQVAALVRFLCSGEAASIVGQTLVVDGGRSLGSG